MRLGFLAVSICTVGATIAPGASGSGVLESTQKATNLATILASEQTCGLTYDQDAIGTWIDKNVDPSDMSFASTLSLMSEGAKYTLSEKSGSALTAHCHSVKRTAAHYGFLTD